MSARNRRKTLPRPIAARSISGNSRGMLTPPVRFSPSMHLGGNLAAIGQVVRELDRPDPVLHQRLVQEGAQRFRTSIVSFDRLRKPQMR